MRTGLTPEEQAQIVRLRTEGLSQRAIAARLARGRATIDKYCKSVGLSNTNYKPGPEHPWYHSYPGKAK